MRTMLAFTIVMLCAHGEEKSSPSGTASTLESGLDGLRASGDSPCDVMDDCYPSLIELDNAVGRDLLDAMELCEEGLRPDED